VVRGGDDVIVTDRGRPVARLTSLDPVEGGAHMDALVRTGVVRPPRRRAAGLVQAAGDPVVADADGRLLKALLEERELGR